jgi:hypothetical protein
MCLPGFLLNVSYRGFLEKRVSCDYLIEKPPDPHKVSMDSEKRGKLIRMSTSI